MTWKTWFKRLMIGYICIMFVFVLISEVLLIRCNEHIFGNKAIQIQLRENALYGTALIEGTLYHKLGIVKEQEPNIIALGSSRVMQFRNKFFYDTEFYTMGGTIGNIVDCIFVNDKIENINHSDIIILGVDLWWLNPNFGHQKMEDKILNKNIVEQRVYIYKRLWYEILFGSNKKLRAALLFPDIMEYEPVGNHKTIGLQAAKNVCGYRLDGSYQYGDLITEPSNTVERFENTHNRINQGIARFERASDIDYAELAKLQEVIRTIKAQGSQLIVFLPPFPEEIYNAMLESDGHRDFMLKFEAAVRELCRQEQTSFYDFSNGAWLNAPDEEFLDGFHGSERTYGKIMLKMAEDPILKPYVNKEYIEKRLQESAHPFQIVPLTE